MKLEAFQQIVETLNAAKVKFILVGGLAVAIHGYGRVTYDVDLVIQLMPENITKAFAALAKLSYRPRVPITADQFADGFLRKKWIEEKDMMVLNLFSDLYYSTPIDIFVKEPFDFEEAYSRAAIESLEDETVFRVVDIETLINMKIEAGRDKDLDDVSHLKVLRDEKA